MLRKKLNLLQTEKPNDGDNDLENSGSKKPRIDGESSGVASTSTQNISKYFQNPPTEMETVSERMITLQKQLNNLLEGISFIKPPISYVYNPAIYAADPYEKYIKLYCNSSKKIIFLGMNPGPFGMCQTGVPFGDVDSVLNWLGIEGHVEQPEVVCSQRLIKGFNCKRQEISGNRFWNFCKNLSGNPQIFFRNCIIYNYCPLAFLKKDGGNVTPAEIKDISKNLLEAACDKILIEVIELLKPEFIIGIGRYAQKRAVCVVKSLKTDIKVIFMPHPSPRSKQNQNWLEKADQFMKEYNLTKYFQE